MNKMILLLVGAYPPDACGIGDYSYQLIHSDKSRWECLVWKDWSIKGLVKLITKINKSAARYVNLQYPTKSSYGSVIPHLLCLYLTLFSRKRIIVTLHEYMRMGKRYRYAGILFLLFAYRVVFTTDAEKAYASKIIHFRSNHYIVIPIFSNILGTKKIKPTNKRNFDLAYFGLISPNRNIENFILLIKKLQYANVGVSASVIGMVSDEYVEYLNKLKEIATDTRIEFYLNMSNKDVAELLNDCKYTYLPYNDGVSERRGTFLASVINGCIVVTTKGPWTLSKFDSVCYYIENNEFELIKELLLREKMDITQEDLIDYRNSYIVHSWNEISNLYHNICV